ncbi:MAG: cyclase family protein [Gemmatimonadales bacterium]
MSRFVVPFLMLSLGACQASGGAAAVFTGESGRWVDLTYSFSDRTIYWPTGRGFKLEEVQAGQTDAGYYYVTNNYSAAEHGGTHLDAPLHFARGKDAADQVPLDRLIGPAVVVDVSDRVTPDYLITVGDLQAWERSHGRIPDGSIVLFRTGWGSRWPDRARYLGTAELGPEAVAHLHFPGISPAAAKWLVEQRAPDAVGIDTPSIDYGQSAGFESHVIVYGANVPGFENVANLDRLPETGSYVVALPMKIEGGSGGPLRIVAWVPSGGQK